MDLNASKETDLNELDNGERSVLDQENTREAGDLNGTEELDDTELAIRKAMQVLVN